MSEEITKRKAGLGYRWIKSSTGSTYLCPASDYSKYRDASDEDLRGFCIDESLNPQND